MLDASFPAFIDFLDFRFLKPLGYQLHRLFQRMACDCAALPRLGAFAVMWTGATCPARFNSIFSLLICFALKAFEYQPVTLLAQVAIAVGVILESTLVERSGLLPDA